MSEPKSCPFCAKADFGVYRVEVTKHYATISTVGGSSRYPKGEQFKFCPECGRKLWSIEQEPRTLTVEELREMINCPVWCEMQPKYYKCGVVGIKHDKSSRERVVIGFSYGFEWIEDVMARTSGKVYDRQPKED